MCVGQYSALQIQPSLFCVPWGGLGIKRMDGCAIPQQFSTSRQTSFLIIPPKISKSFFSSLNFFYILQNFEKSIDHAVPVVKLMVSVITNSIISNGGIPLILFLFPAISNRCIQKKGINKLIFHKDIYMEGESLNSFTAGQACAASVSHRNIAIQRTQLTTFSFFIQTKHNSLEYTRQYRTQALANANEFIRRLNNQIKKDSNQYMHPLMAP